MIHGNVSRLVTEVDVDQMTIRLEGEEAAAFRRAREAGFRSAQQQARKYIVEGLRREGLLSTEKQEDTDRAERSGSPRAE
jgi:hypothetical protein